MNRVDCEGPAPAAAEGPTSPDWVALAGAAATLVLHLVLQAEGPNRYFMGGACLFWASFVLIRARQDPGAFRRWGFRADNLPRAAVAPAVVFVVVAGGFATYAAVRGTLIFPAHAWLLLLLYPVWGLIQQLLVLGVVLGNLERVPALRRHKALLVLPTAALFGLVHVPDLLLVAGTFLLGLVIVLLYLKDRNLWPLGVLHGWLGALFYLWVLGRDMWVENFG
jgi:hypothetical protein